MEAPVNQDGQSERKARGLRVLAPIQMTECDHKFCDVCTVMLVELEAQTDVG